MNKLGQQAVVTGIATIVFWTMFGYRYFVTGAGLESVPLIKRYVNSSYMPHDYYLNFVTSEYNHREVFTRLTGEVSKFLGSVELSFLVLFIAVMIATIWAIVVICQKWSYSFWGHLFSVIGTLLTLYIIVRMLSPGAVTILRGELTANTVARAFLLWAIVASISGKHWLAISLVTIGTLFHPLDSLLTFPLIAILMFRYHSVHDRRIWNKRLFVILIGSILVLCAFIFPNLDAFTNPIPDRQLVELISLRFPHHYLPHTWQIWTWVYLAALFLFGTLSLLMLQEKDIGLACLIVLILFVVYIVVISVQPTAMLYKFRGAKLLWGSYILWTLAIFSMITRLYTNWSRRSLTRMVGIPTGAIFLSLVLVFSLMNSSQSYRLIELERRAAFNLGQLKKGNYRTAKAYAPKSHRELSEWLKYNTAPSAVILHPPQINEVRSIAERASVLLNTLPPFGRRGTIEWLERFSKVQYYCEKDIRELNDLAVSYGASYIAIKKECAAIQEISQPLYSSDSWYVVQVEGKTN